MKHLRITQNILVNFVLYKYLELKHIIDETM